MYNRRIEQPKNNALHEAILARNHETALELVAKMSAQEINQPSLGNTPLMLCLKTANFPVALKILERDDVDVGLTDHRGMSPLHLACAWRANDVILILLKKCNDAGIPADSGFDFDKLTGIDTLAKKLLAHRTLAKIYNAYDYDIIRKMIINSDFDKNIVEGKSLCILPAPELTDALLFHSRSICLNLHLKDGSEFENKESKQYEFASDLMTGLNAIIEYRNSLPKDEHITSLLTDVAPKLDASTTRPKFY